MFYVYCPEKQERLLRDVLEGRGLSFEVNPVLSSLDRKTESCILFYNANNLPDDLSHILIDKVEHNFLVKNLIHYLEEKENYTEIDLLTPEYFLYESRFSQFRNSIKIFTKRILDIVVSFSLIILMSPVMLLVVLSIPLESRGSPIYRQKRMGRFRQEFYIYKFRSMDQNAEQKGGPQWATKGDVRVTKIGRILRKMRIDELPQLYNVLKGEMSLVGPRPERKIFMGKLRKEIPFYDFRHAVKPGLTGWAQVNYPYANTLGDARTKHKYDLYYIKHQSFFFDLKILFLTIFTVIFGKGH